MGIDVEYLGYCIFMRCGGGYIANGYDYNNVDWALGYIEELSYR